MDKIYFNLFGGESLDIQQDSDLDRILCDLDNIKPWQGLKGMYNNMPRPVFRALFTVVNN